MRRRASCPRCSLGPEERRRSCFRRLSCLGRPSRRQFEHQRAAKQSLRLLVELGLFVTARCYSCAPPGYHKERVSRAVIAGLSAEQQQRTKQTVGWYPVLLPVILSFRGIQPQRPLALLAPLPRCWVKDVQFITMNPVCMTLFAYIPHLMFSPEDPPTHGAPTRGEGRQQTQDRLHPQEHLPASGRKLGQDFLEDAWLFSLFLIFSAAFAFAMLRILRSVFRCSRAIVPAVFRIVALFLLVVDAGVLCVAGLRSGFMLEDWSGALSWKRREDISTNGPNSYRECRNVVLVQSHQSLARSHSNSPPERGWFGTRTVPVTLISWITGVFNRPITCAGGASCGSTVSPSARRSMSPPIFAA